jgi:hypothetical protein
MEGGCNTEVIRQAKQFLRQAKQFHSLFGVRSCISLGKKNFCLGSSMPCLCFHSKSSHLRMIFATFFFLCILSESKNKILKEMKKLNEVRTYDNTRTAQEYLHDTYQDPSLALASPSTLAGGWYRRPGFTITQRDQ